MNQPARLRSADWRFLLPVPPEGVFQRMVLLNAPTGLAECLRQTGIAKEILSELPKTRSADAVIVLDAAQIALGDLADRLRPGGIVYLEVDPRSSWLARSAPARVTRDLRRVGLTPVGAYLTSRNPARRHAYLPLDCRGAVRWFGRTFVAPGTFGTRLLAWLLSTSGRFGHLSGLVPTPRHVLIAVAGPGGDVPPALLSHPALPPQIRRPNGCALLVTPGTDDLNRVVMLPFAPDGHQPLAVVKLPRRTDGNSLAEHEQLLLTTIRSKLDQTMRQTIPEPYGTLQIGGLSAGLESCAPGRALTRVLGRWGTPLREKNEQLERALTWLVDFHRQAEVTRLRWGGSESREWLEEPLAAYKSALSTTSKEERLFAALLDQSRSLNGYLLPAVMVHWNFSMSHIFATNDGLTVVDWEGVAPGPPLFDLLFFVMHWAYAVQRLRHEEEQVAAFRQLFGEPVDSDSIATTVHRAIVQYMVELDIDRRFYPLLLVMMCVVRALGRVNRHEGAIEPEEARRGNRYVRYIEVLAERVEHLFPECVEHASGGGLRAVGS